MNESKPWWKSKTVVAIIAMISIVCTQFFGVEVTTADLQEILASAGFVVASLVAIWGRLTAKKDITLK